MNILSLKNSFTKFGILILTFMFSTLTFAQEAAKTLDVDVTTTKTTTTTQWYTNPLYLVLGALLLIILVAIIARGGKRN